MGKSPSRRLASNILEPESVSWVIGFACVCGFLHLNWGNTLDTVVALTRFVFSYFSQHDPYSAKGKDAFIMILGQSTGLAIYFALAFAVLNNLSKNLYSLMDGPRRKAISQEKYNRMKSKFLSREALNLEQIEFLQIERKQDRKLITELRETLVTTKLELESLDIGKSSKRKPRSSPLPSNDLFTPERKKPGRSKPKRYVPNLLRRKTPKF